MRKTTTFIAVSTVLAVASGAARAETGFFAFASVGDSSAKLDELTFQPPSDDGRSFEIGFGYAFNPYLAVQAAYHDFGDYDSEVLCVPPDAPFECPPIPFQADISGWSLRVTGSYPLGEQFAAFANAGVLVWDADLSFALADDSAVFTNSSEGDDLIYEAGLRWRFSDRWNLQASYEKVNLDIETAKLGVLFRF